MILEKTYFVNLCDGSEKDIEPGPALRMDLGNGAHKDVVGPENGWFPGTVATAGVAVKVENADASQKKDLESILRILAGSDKDAPPPAHCQGYDAVNKAYHALFRGPAMVELAMGGKSEELRQLLEAGSEAVDHMSAGDGSTPLFKAVEKGRVIYAGIQKFVAFIMSVHMGEVVQIFFCIVVGVPVPSFCIFG